MVFVDVVVSAAVVVVVAAVDVVVVVVAAVVVVFSLVFVDVDATFLRCFRRVLVSRKI